MCLEPFVDMGLIGFMFYYRVPLSRLSWVVEPSGTEPSGGRIQKTAVPSDPIWVVVWDHLLLVRSKTYGYGMLCVRAPGYLG